MSKKLPSSKLESRPEPAQLAALDRLAEARDWDTLRARAAGLYEKFPGNTRVFSIYCAALLNSGRPYDAVSVARAWTDSYPNASRAWEVALDCYDAAALPALRCEAAERLAATAIIAPTRLAGARFEFDNLIAAEPGIDAAQARAIELALASFASGERHRARQSLGALGHRRARLFLARFEFEEGNLEAAIAIVRELLAQHPEYLSCLTFAARVLMYTGEAQEAFALIDRAAALRTESPEVVGDQIEALVYFARPQAALDAYSSFPTTILDRIDRRGRGRVRHVSAVAAQRLGRTVLTLQLWREAAADLPDSTVVRINLANVQRPVEEQVAPFINSIAFLYVRPDRERLRRDASAAGVDLSRVEHVQFRRLRLAGHSAHLERVAQNADPCGSRWALLELLARALDGEALAASILARHLDTPHGPDSDRLWLIGEMVAEAYLAPGESIRAVLRGEARLIAPRLPPQDVHPYRHLDLPTELRREFQRAVLLRYRNELDEARDALAKLVEQAPDSLVARHELALTLLDTDRSRAEALFDECIARDARFIPVHISRARLMAVTGGAREARATLEDLSSHRLSSYADYHELFSALADVCAGLGEHADEANLAASLACLESMIDRRNAERSVRPIRV